MGGRQPKEKSRKTGASGPSEPDLQSWYVDSIESAPFGILIHDRNGRILHFNTYLENLSGYSAEEIPDIQSWLRKLYPDEQYRKVVLGERSQPGPEGEVRVRETIITTRTGNRRLCRFYSRTAASGVRTVMIQNLSIGNRATNSAAILKFEQSQSQFYSTPTPLLIWESASGDFILATHNRAANQLTGGHIGRCLGRSIRDIIDGPLPLMEGMRRCIEQRTNVECSQPCRLPGTASDVEFDCTFLYLPPNYAVMHISIKTQLLRATENLRQSELRYRELVDMIPITIFEVDTEGNYEFINSQGLKLLGCTPDELKHLNSIDLIVEKDRERARDNFAKVISGRKSGPNAYTARTPDGRRLPITLHTTPVVRDGSVVGLLGYAIDDSERVKAERDLKKAYAEIERQVEERTRELEAKTEELIEVNTALRVLLREQQTHKSEIEEQIRINAGELIRPLLAKLKRSRLTPRQQAWLQQALQNLDNITSPLGRMIHNHHEKLTPAELQVAELVKNGKTTKEAAEILDLAVRTVESHRKNIRRKLGLKNKKVNLRTYLLSL